VRKTLLLVLAVGLGTLGALALADSPITSTDFWKAYKDYPVVQKAAREKTMSLEFAEYLSNPSTPIGVKAAVINALSWAFEGKHNAELYRYYLALRYRCTLDELTPDLLNADEVFCLGYLTVMDDYFHPEGALPLLEAASRRRRNSFTVAIVLALTRAQKAMDDDLEKVWPPVKRVLDDKNLQKDLRPEAVKIILDYMKLYAK